jgi:hypothetical protein
MVESNQNRLERVREFLVLLVIDLTDLVRSSLLPMADFCWNSFLDLLILVNTPETRNQLKRSVMSPLMAIESRLEALLPDSFKHERPIKTVGLLLLMLFLGLLLSGDTNLEDLKKSGELVVISRESPTTLYQDSEGPAGPEYDYLKSFAEFLGVTLRLEMRDNNQDILSSISKDEGHIAAAGMTFYPPLEDKGYVFGPGYQDVDIQVVCRRNHGKRPRDVAALNDVELVVVADSTYESRLFELQA